jgi:hypothetical protein
MKPSISVKTKSGKRYLQVRTAFGDLIHIGPTTNTENWRVAYRALCREYTVLANQELAALKPFIAEANVQVDDILTNISVASKEWNKYSDKLDKSIEYRVKLRDLYNKIHNPKFLWPGEQKILRRMFKGKKSSDEN